MARRGTTRSTTYGARRSPRPKRSNPGPRRRRNPGAGAAAKAKQATINTVVVAGTAIGYGALSRRVELPHLDFLGEAGTYAAAAWAGGHLLNNAPLKYIGAGLGAIELWQRSVVWFETDEQKAVREALEARKKELEAKIKLKRPMMISGDENYFPGDAETEEPEGSEAGVAA
jgi:hypothetical protein